MKGSITSASKKKTYTYDDYVKLDDNKRYELIGGELIMTPSPDFCHQTILYKLTNLIGNFVDQNNIGILRFAPLDVCLDEFNVVQPDILFISNKRKNIIKEKCIKGVPDLVIEVLSESSLQKDKIEKKELYERFRVREYWIVDPKNRAVEIYILKDNKYTLWKIFHGRDVVISRVIKRLKISLKEIFNFK